MITETFAQQVLETLEYWLDRTVDFSAQHPDYKYSFDDFVIYEEFSNPIEAALYLKYWLDK